jgi:hypothetical protein
MLPTKPALSLSGLIPLSQAAAALGKGYQATRDAALRGELELHFQGRRMYVTAASVKARKAAELER